MKGPLISIIIPVYNTEEYIRTCVEVLNSQTYKDLQIILVDDGSKDNSPKICDELAEKFGNVKTIHQENSGIFMARIAGISIADGDYIAFSDSDDYCEPNMYELLMSNMLKEEADISHCSYEMIRGDKKTPYYGTGKRIIQDRITGVKDILEGKFIEPTLCTKLFKKELFEGVGSDCRVDSFEDLLFNVQLFIKSKKSVYEDVVMYHYIKREGSTSRSRNYEREIEDTKNVTRQIYEVAKNDKDIIPLVKSRIVSQWVNEYNAVLFDAPQYCNVIRKNLPKGIKSISVKRNIFFFMIKHTPHLYKLMRKVHKGV